MRAVFLLTTLLSVLGFGCSAQWLPFSSRPYQEGAFPETHVTYFRYSFELPKEKSVKIRIRGQVPQSRYFTFNLYSEDSRSSIGSLPDTQLIVDGLKTFRMPRVGEAYTVWLTSQHDEHLSNQILLTPNADRSFEIWYRVYLPETDPLGGVALPQIEAFSEDGLQFPTCLKTLPPLATQPMVLGDMSKLPPRPNESREIFFYANRGLGFYNNGDNHYLSARLDFSKGQLFALLKFKAPTFGKSFDATVVPDVRYFSFCIGSARTTATSGCIADQNMQLATQGYTYLLIGPEEEDGINFKRLAEAKGINFLPKGKNFMPLIIYRHVLVRPDFAGRFNYQFAWPPDLSEVSKEEATSLYAQHRLIGDYSPLGQQMTAQEAWAWLNQQ